MTIKPPIKTNVRLPTLGITSIRPNDTRETFWQTTNDQQFIEKNADVFADFEEMFKLNSAPKPIDKSDKDIVLPVARQLDSLLEHTR